VPYKDLTLQHEYQRQWIAARRAKAISDRGGRCTDCGATERLEFHHRDPAEKISHRIYSWAWPKIEAELAKCELLCSACHLEQTIPFSRAKALAQPRNEYGFIRVPRMAPGLATSHGREKEDMNDIAVA
jgi:5-methylcytosine-specific restriction endonuclease McrA